MAQIRKLKNEIKSIAGELIGECETYLRFHPETEIKKIEKIIAAIEEKEHAFIHELNHLKNSKDVKSKAYCNSIIDRLKKEMIPLLDKVGDLATK